MGDYESTEATDLGASSRLRNYEITSLQRPLIWEPARDYEITRLRADRCLFFLGKVKLRNYEITRLRADRCLFFSGEGQFTRLRDYEFTEATDLGASSRLRDYEITRLRADRCHFFPRKGEITR